MDNSTILSLPYIMPAQAQKHVTHNEALQMLDAIIQLCAQDFSRTMPPLNPQEGQRHIVATGATGEWEDKDNMLAIWENGIWRFFQPNTGWSAYIVSEAGLRIYDGQQWVTSSSSTSYERLSINTDMDPNHRLAVRGASTFLNGDDSDHRLLINKGTSSATASVVFQTEHTGHAEMGLTGSDNFAF